MAVAPGSYTVTAKAIDNRNGATVSAPVTWDEVKKGKLKIQDFTIKTMLKRIENVGDLFKGAVTQKQSLSSALNKIAKEWTARNV